VPDNLDPWTIFASTGEYQERAKDAITALAQFTSAHPDDHVSAVVNDLMRPRLILEDD
jgi:hypothetical protein